MTALTAPAEAATSPQRLAASLRAEQLRLFDANMASMLLGNGLVAVLLLAVLWPALPRERIGAWLAVLVATLAWRAGWSVARRGAATLQPDDRTALLRVRWSVAAAGVAWGLAGVLLYPQDDLALTVFLVFVLTGVAAGSVILSAFDPYASLPFAGLTLTPLVLRLLASGRLETQAMAAMSLAFVGLLVLTGLRVWRNLHETMVMRAAEAVRTEALVRSEQRLLHLSDQLARKTQALEVTLDSMDQGILSLGEDGRTQVYNRRLSELTDLPPHFLAGGPTLDEIARYQAARGHFGSALSLVDEAARERFALWLDGDRQALPELYHRRTPQGVMLEVKTRYLAGGAMVRTFTDVTAYVDAQQQLSASEAQARKLALVAAHTDNAVAVLNAERRIDWVNDSFTRMLGWTPAEVTGRLLVDFLYGPASRRDEWRRIDAQLTAEGQAWGEDQVSTRDARVLWLAVEFQAVTDAQGRFSQYIAIGRDISARKQAEAAWRSARDEAEQANRAKSEFLSAMSHELRTPMNAILGFAQLLAVDGQQPLPPRQQAQVQQILHAGEHLLGLIDDVLDLARVESGKQSMSLGPLLLASVLQACLGLMRPLAQQAGVQLAALDGDSLPEPGLRVIADVQRLRQVLLNLLSNAIKYNAAAGSVRLRAVSDGDMVRIEVHDDGPGIDPTQRERLFHAFERLGAENSGVPGAGIGLALTRRLVERMHGRIGVDSPASGGSCFWVCLPGAAPGDQAPQPVLPAASTVAIAGTPVEGDASASRRVLYIEDNPVNATLMEAMLAQLPDIVVSLAALPEEGLAMARAQRPDLILLDIQLPGMDGYEVLRRLRADPATRGIPVAAISANAMLGDVERGRAAGFDAYLPKPMMLDDLLAYVRQVLRL
jgi:PAS domain S-box-containing protein